MNAEDVVQKILSEAQAEADRILSEAKEKVAIDESSLESTLADYRKESETLAAAAGAEKKSRMLATARMELRKESLTCSQELLEEVFKKAEAQIVGMEDDGYCQLMESLMVKAVETGSEEVVVGNEESRIDNGFIKQINRKLGPGFKGNLQLAQDRVDIGGGFILRRGKVQTNVSIEVLISQARQELEIELAASLFE